MRYPRLKGKRCIGLARCSTKGQADTSIDDQLVLIASFVREHEMVLIDNITLDGVSGSIPGNRTDIESLIVRKRDHDDFDLLIVQDTTRLTRSGPKHGAKIEYDLNAVGIEVIYVTDDVPDGEYSDIMKSMLYMSGKQQAKSISMASARGSMSSLLQGRSAYCRRPPYGIDRLYISADDKPVHIIRNLPDGSQVKLDPKTKEIIGHFGRNDRRGVPHHYIKQKDERIELIPGDEERLAVVRFIYSHYHIDNWGYPRIACELNDQGKPSPTGKLWHVATTRIILLNSIYIGLGIANRYTNAIYYKRAPDSPSPSQVDTKTLAQDKQPPTKVRPRSEWIEKEVSNLTDVLDVPLRELANRKHQQHLDDLASGRQPDVNKDRHRQSEYLLKGILTSKQGGYAMTGRRSGNNRYYNVSRAFDTPRTKDKLLRKSIPAEPLEKMVLSILQAMLIRAPDIRKRIEEMIRRQQRDSTRDNSNLSTLQDERETVQRKLEFVIDELDELGRDAVKAKVKKLQNQLRSIDDRISRCQPVAKLSHQNVADSTDTIIQRITQLGESMDNLPLNAIRRLLEVVIHRIVVDLETRDVELELRLPSWLMDTSKPMCLDTTFGCKTDIETHRENSVVLMKMRLMWWQQRYDYGAYDFGNAA